MFYGKKNKYKKGLIHSIFLFGIALGMFCSGFILQSYITVFFSIVIAMISFILTWTMEGE
jgi:hypothetical protein